MHPGDVFKLKPCFMRAYRQRMDGCFQPHLDIWKVIKHHQFSPLIAKTRLKLKRYVRHLIE